MNIDKEQLLKELKEAKTKLTYGGIKKQKLANNLGEFLSLNADLGVLLGEKLDENDFFYDPQKAYNFFNVSEYESYIKFRKFIEKNGSNILTIFKNYDETLDDIEFYPMQYFKKLRKYNEKEYQDIILSYFSTYSKNIYEIAKKYFDENRIEDNYKNSPDQETYGYFCGIKCNKSGYIFVTLPNRDSYTASVLVHELGHAIDAELFLFKQQKKLTLSDDIFIETISMFFETNFYDYLIHNYIDYEGGQILINDNYNCIKNISKDIIAYMNNPEILLGLSSISLSDINDTADIEYDDKFDDLERFELEFFRRQILYGLGGYFALHLNYLKNEMPKEEFEKIFMKFVTSRKEKTFKDLVEVMGLDIDKFISGEYIKPKIENDTLKLKKRYFE